MEMTWKASTENLPAVTSFIDEQLEALACPLKAQMQIDVAIDEIFSNIAFYAYGQEPGDVTVRFDYDDTQGDAILTFTDNGATFNPLEAETPDVTLSAEERKIGGLGIFLVRKTMDEVTYRHENGCNILTIRKRLRGGKL